MIGETIKDFTITALLGRGGMGEVFVGEQRLIKTKVAIKMLRPEISADQAHVNRFFNEAIAVGKIRHAGIVKIFDVGFHGGRAYLVMEFLDGEPLSARLRGSLPFGAAIEIARQITSVLDATHAAGITHRDLKPDNIFLVPDSELGERVRILDFGIAKLGDVQATAAQMSMGTPAYMAPELWKDAATSGPPTDVYAFGCLLFELLCGRPPFQVTAVSDACGRHLTETPPRLRTLRPELPVTLDELIATMLAKEQPDRPTTKQIASALLALATTGVASSAPAISKSAATAPLSPSRSGDSPLASRSADSIPPRTAIGHDSAAPGTPLPRDPAISDDDAALAAKYEVDKRWMDLVKLLAKHAEAVAPANRAAYHLRVAEIYQDRFANQAEALKAYERVLECDRVNRKAIDQLRALYEKRRDWEKYFELEKGELDRLTGEAQRDRAVELARLASSRVGKPEVTIYWWQRVLEYDSAHSTAIAELAKSFERSERWMDLIAVLTQQAEQAPGNDGAIEALAKIALIQEDKLADSYGARSSWQQILDRDPKHAGANKALDRIEAAESAPPAIATAPGKPAASANTKPVRPSVDAGKSSNEESPSNDTGRDSKPGDARDSKSDARDSSPTSTKRNPTGKIAIGVLVLAAAGIGIYFATRSKPAAAERDIGTPSPRMLQVLGDKHIAYRVVDGRVLVAADAPDIQIVAEVVDPPGSGKVAEAPGSGSGSASAATASGLTLSYRVLSRPAAGGELHVVKPNDELHSDDRLVFEVMVSEQASLYVAQSPRGRHLSVVFPNTGIPVTNPLPANTWIRLPPGDKSFRINSLDVGVETAYFIAARAPIKNLESAIKNQGVTMDLNWFVDDAIVKVAMDKRTDCAGKGREIVLDSDDPCKAKTRGIELDDDAGAKPAKRVRGMTKEDAVFVPFSFKHVPAHPATLEIGNPRGDLGGYTSEAIKRVLETNSSKLADCYEQGGGSPRVHGSLVLHLTINPEGNMTSTYETVMNRLVGECVKAVVGKLVVPPQKPPADVVTRLEFVP